MASRNETSEQIQVIPRPTGTRGRETEESDPVVNTKEYHYVDLAGSTQIKFTYAAITPVNITLYKNGSHEDSKYNQSSLGQVLVGIYGAQHNNHHNKRYTLTVTDARQRSGTASTVLYIN